MATLFKRPGSPNYYGRFQYKGRNVCFSTETANRKDALNALKKKQAEVRGEVSLSALFDQVVEQVAMIEDAENQNCKRREFAGRLLQGTTSKLAVSDAWQIWLTAPKKRDPSQATIDSYRGQWDAFTKWLAEKHAGVEYLHEVTDTIAKGYASRLWADGNSPSTFNRHIKFLRSMFALLRTQSGLINNPWAKDKVPNREKDQESKRNLEPEELETLCSNATGDLRYMFGLGLYMGARLGDVVMLKWREKVVVDGKARRLGIDFDKGRVAYMPLKTRRKKKIVEVEMHPILTVLLLELRKKSDRGTEYLFSDMARLYQKDPSAVSKIIQKHFKDCGIETTEPANGHRRKRIVRVGFHSLRHSFVSLCAANQVPVVAIQQLVGHGSPAMTDLYSHMGIEETGKYIAALPAVSFGNGGEK